eukprot:CCRYP_008724-RA/>CCRYP_008724-RA protein AED:0.04 eAED:0.04 QI:644/0.5/0.33/1/0/0/3/0/135
MVARKERSPNSAAKTRAKILAICALVRSLCDSLRPLRTLRPLHSCHPHFQTLPTKPLHQINAITAATSSNGTPLAIPAGTAWKTCPITTEIIDMTANAPSDPTKEMNRESFAAKSAATKNVLSPISLKNTRLKAW